MSITIRKKDLNLSVKIFNFPAGEVGVKLDTANLKYRYLDEPHIITARLQSSNDILSLLMVTDALNRWDKRPIKLFIPYFNYMQQDRVCDAGESLSVKVFADLINSAGFDEVAIVDPHSDVTGALINNLRIITAVNIIDNFEALNKRLFTPGVVFVSPDAGANKKVSKMAGYMQHREFVRADKLRDLTTGQIIETTVYAEDLTGQTCVILDDIIVGGATFAALGRVLKERGAKAVILYVTHGIFARGLTIENVDEIYSTNSYRTDIGEPVKVFDIEKVCPF